MIRAIIKKMLSEKTIRRVQNIENASILIRQRYQLYGSMKMHFMADFIRYKKHSAAPYLQAFLADGNTLPAISEESLAAIIRIDYHRLEKGLSLKDPRPRFAKIVAERLIRNIERYRQKHGHAAVTLTGIHILTSYQTFLNSHSGMDERLSQNIDSLSQSVDLEQSAGGTIALSKDDIVKSTHHVTPDFFYSRHSIRQFSEQPVSMQDIEQAVSMAQKSPSVCNRQSCKVYAVQDKALKQAVLETQNGNAGFTEQIDTAVIITSNIQNFVSIGERNQCWVDGGMFAMSFVYALHSLGLGTCCLNWCVEKAQDAKLRAIMQIPGNEVIITLLAVGHIPDKTIEVAASVRRSTEDMLIRH